MFSVDAFSIHLSRAFGDEAVENIQRATIATRVRGQDVIIKATKGKSEWTFDVSLNDTSKLGLKPLPTDVRQ